jgi:hypothetical protein
MSARISVALLALALAFGNAARATPIEDIRDTNVSQLEFGGFKLEVGLMGIKDWPFPIEGASVSFGLDPDRIEIVVAVQKAAAQPFRTVCTRTIERVRGFLYVDADGVPLMGRSHLGGYFRGPWRGAERETALRGLDAAARIRVDVVGSGTCQAALIKGPINFLE